MATSALNPNAPIFVPLAYREVEDFSDEWWDLVQSSPWFRDYWLHECFTDPQIVESSPFLDIGLDDAVLEDNATGENAAAKEKEGIMELAALGWLKWRKQRGAGATPRYCEKAPKIVNMRLCPRPIQQPR